MQHVKHNIFGGILHAFVFPVSDSLLVANEVPVHLVQTILVEIGQIAQTLIIGDIAFVNHPILDQCRRIPLLHEFINGLLPEICVSFQYH